MHLNKILKHRIELNYPFALPDGLSAMNNGLNILNYLHSEILKAFNGIDDISSYMRNYESFDRLRIKFFSLASSYIINVITIDGIFKASYLRMKKNLNEFGFNSLKSDKQEMAKRYKELEVHRWYRDKVFAHTSYSDPKKDSDSLQQTSLYYYAGNFFGIKDNHFLLGGGALIVDVYEEYPSLDIYADHEKIKTHFIDWENMFLSVLHEVYKFPELIEKMKIR